MLVLTTEELRNLFEVIGPAPAPRPHGTRAEWRRFERRMLKGLWTLKGRAFAEKARFEGVNLTTPCDHHLIVDGDMERGGP